MKYKGMWTRWHRFDDNGTKFIRHFKIGETPEPLIEEGYSAWARGTGPLSKEHYENVANALRKFSAGVPKSEAQKEKMRQAKLGVPKSEAHRKAIAQAWVKRRQNRYLEAKKIIENMRQNNE